jgi:hypothetical protein
LKEFSKTLLQLKIIDINVSDRNNPASRNEGRTAEKAGLNLQQNYSHVPRDCSQPLSIVKNY